MQETYLALKSKYASRLRATLMDLNEEKLSRVALDIPQRDPEENLLDVVRGVDDLEMLDEKVSEN